MPVPSRYVGESNAYDIANDKVYMGDLVWSWDVGDPLADWTLGGTTSPTLAPDGQLDLFDNINAANQTSECYVAIPNTIGGMWAILHCKFTMQTDDTSTDGVRFIGQISSSTTAQRGLVFQVNPVASNIRWYANTGAGPNANMTFVPVAGQEYVLDLVVSSSEVIIMVNNERFGSFPTGMGNLPLTPLVSWNSSNKIIYFYARHDAGEVSHFRCRDVRVSRLVGVSSL